MSGEARDDQEFVRLALRALGNDDPADSIGKGGHRISTGRQQAMVELVVRNVRNGDLRPAFFLQHPEHLPRGEELKKLLLSTAERDEQLKRDAREWWEVNQRQIECGAVALRNAIVATRIADELMNDDGADEVLHEWKHEILAYVRVTFACEPLEAPAGDERRGELDAWCRMIVARENPCPAVLDPRNPKFAAPTPHHRPTAETRFADRFRGSERGDDRDD